MQWDEISLGDYVVAGGELPAMVVLESVVRLLPGVLGCPQSPSSSRSAMAPSWTIPTTHARGNTAG